MDILYIARFLPHPKSRDSGGQDSFHYIEALSQKHNIYLVAFTVPGQEKAIEVMRSFCRHVEPIPFNCQALHYRLWRAGWRLILPKIYGRNISLRFALKSLHVASTYKPDVILIDGMMAIYGLMLTKNVRILDEVDVYSQVVQQTIGRKHSLISRILAWLEWHRTLVFERALARTYSGIIVRSKKDKVWLTNHSFRIPIRVISPWFEGLDELLTIDIKRPAGNSLLFMGAMNNPKNIDAALFLTNEVLPLVQTKVPDVTLMITGANPVAQIQELSKIQWVTVTGTVPDLKPFYEQCVVNVVPLLTGGGIIVKTLNGLAAGRPTICTSYGISGINAKIGQDLFVVPTEPAKIAQAIVEVLLNDKKWYSMAHSGRRFILENYDWQKTVKTLELFMNQLSKGSSSYN